MLLPHAESGLTPKKGERERKRERESPLTTTTGHLLSRSFPLLLLLLFLAGLVDTFASFFSFFPFSLPSLSPSSLFCFPFHLIIHDKQPRENLQPRRSIAARPTPAVDLSFPFISPLPFLLLGACSLCRCYFLFFIFYFFF